MGVVIDTNIFISAENERYDLTKLTSYSQYGNAYIAAVTISELLVGVHLAKNLQTKIRRTAFIEGIISTIPALEFNEEVARVYAQIYGYFLQPRRIKQTNVHDLQIAATSITYGFPILTNNTADFKKIPGVKLAKPEKS